MELRESIDVDFSRYLLVLKRHWKPAAIVFLFIVLLSFVATKFLKPSYGASGKLLFRVPSFQVLGTNLLPSSSEGGDSGDLKSLVSTNNPISTQIEVISSPAILQKTIDTLKLKDKKGEPLEVSSLASAVTMKIIGGTDVLEISYKSPKAEEAAAVVNCIMNFYLEKDIKNNRNEAGTTRVFMSKQLPKNRSAVHDAEIALRRFREENDVTDLAEETKSTIAIIGSLEAEINNIQAQLADMTAQNTFLQQKIGLTSQEAIDVSTLSYSQAIQGILTQLNEINRQLAIERSRFSDNSPVIISLESKQANLQDLLQNQIRKTVFHATIFPSQSLQIGELRQKLIQDFLQVELQSSGMEKRLSSLYRSLYFYRRKMKRIPLLVQTQNELDQKLVVAQSTYQTILKKVQELKLAENRNTTSAQIISVATVPKKAISGTKIILLMAGFTMGLFFAATTILFLELRDKSLKTLKEIKELYGYTLIGMIPLLGKKVVKKDLRYLDTTMVTPYIVVRDEPYSLPSEMYRMIQANLRLLSTGKVPKTIVVTSAISQEGKSTVAANLAMVIAQLGRQVLLIDADMRLPYQHLLWQMKNISGLSNALAGQAEYGDIITSVIENLDVLTGGTRPPNPLALLDSKQMRTLIADCSVKYDFVIIDTPSVLIGADALTLSQMADGVLLVTRPGVIDFHGASAAKEMLKRSNCNILGLLINGVIEKNEANNYFYHPKEEYLTSQSMSRKKKISLR